MTLHLTMNLKLVVLLAALLVAADGYHILCIFSIPSKSHNHLGQGFVKALLRAGHEVTWVTPYPPKDPEKGLNIIDASVTKPMVESIDMTDPQRKGSHGMAFVRQFAADISTSTGSIPALKQVLVNGKFDAVVTETFFSDVDAGYAAILKVPWIVLSGTVLMPTTEALVDEVRSVPILPLLFNDFGVPMTFFERMINVGVYNLMALDDWWVKSETVARYESMFSPLAAARNVPLPPLDEALKNVSILFVNSHPSFAPAQSMAPNVIEIGGYHIGDTVQTLPKDLQDILDASPQGVVYFSMGSVLKSSAFPATTRRDLLKMLGDLPYTVLWKFEEELPNLPKNVHIRSWMPQSAILAHKNTKVFITHGGLLSNLEALRYGVPLVSLPVFGDQPANAARAVRSGYAVRVTFDTATMAGELKTALQKILETDEYTNRVKYLSSLFNKRPVPASQLISHYVELAIESKGAYHLRSKANLYTWYQRWMLDILLFILIALYISYIIAKKVIKAILNKICGMLCKKNKVKRN